MEGSMRWIDNYIPAENRAFERFADDHRLSKDDSIIEGHLC